MVYIEQFILIELNAFEDLLYGELNIYIYQVKFNNIQKLQKNKFTGTLQIYNGVVEKFQQQQWKVDVSKL